MKLYLLSLVAFRTLDSALSVLDSWTGDLPYNIYGSEGCDSAVIVPGSATELHALPDGELCETDVLGNDTLYTKIQINQCGTEEEPDNIYLTLYDCDTSTCESCEETPEVVGYAVKDLFEWNSLTTNIDQCFGWATTSYTNQSSLSILAGEAVLAYQQFQSPATIEELTAYWEVFVSHNCMGEFIGYETTTEATAISVLDSWTGDLSYNIYGSEGCDSAVIMSGSSTELHALPDGELCETDVLGNDTLYTKIKINQCGTEEEPDNIYVTLYDCDTSTCESCEETPEVVGYAAKDLFEWNSLTTNIDQCFGWATTSYTNQSSFSILAGEATQAYQQFQSPATIEELTAYWEVFVSHNCMGEFIGYETTTEATANSAFNVGHITASTVMIISVGALLGL